MAAGRASERWLTVSEAAHSLGMSRTTLLAAEEAGMLVPLRTPGGHRRYSPAELTRYLERCGAPPVAASSPVPATRPDGPGEPPALVAAVRSALRPAVQALDGDSGGMYLRRDGALRFVAAFGVPRWLAERLSDDPAPAPVAQAADTGRHRLFDAAEAGFPEPRSTGHGLAAPLEHVEGVLFLVRPAGRELLPGELRMVDAFRDLLGAMVADQRRMADLEHRLARIAALTTP